MVAFLIITFNFIITVTLLLFFLGLPIYIPILIRAYRLRRISKKFSLSYKHGFCFSFEQLPYQETNQIRGKLSGHDVFIADVLSYTGIRISVGHSRDRFGERSTILNLDSKKNRKLCHHWLGYAPVSIIKKTLEEIQQGKKISTFQDKKQSRITPFVFAWIFIIIFAILVFWSKH